MPLCGRLVGHCLQGIGQQVAQDHFELHAVGQEPAGRQRRHQQVDALARCPGGELPGNRLDDFPQGQHFESRGAGAKEITQAPYHIGGPPRLRHHPVDGLANPADVAALCQQLLAGSTVGSDRRERLIELVSQCRCHVPGGREVQGLAQAQADTLLLIDYGSDKEADKGQYGTQHLQLEDSHRHQVLPLHGDNDAGLQGEGCDGGTWHALPSRSPDDGQEEQVEVLELARAAEAE